MYVALLVVNLTQKLTKSAQTEDLLLTKNNCDNRRLTTNLLHLL
jgi:hypothetical protein